MATTQESTFGQRKPISDYEVRYEERIRHDDGSGERSVGSLLGELAGETSALVRAEITLARKEMKDNLSTVQRGAMAMGAGAGVSMAGLLALVAAVILRLALVWPSWAAAAIVGVVITIAGAIMLAIGKRQASAGGFKPGRTLRSLNDMKLMTQYERERATRKWR